MAKAKREKKDWFPAEIVVYSIGKVFYVVRALDGLADGREVASYKLIRRGKVYKTVGIAYNDSK